MQVKDRYFGLDIVRVMAICMVLITHCCECFYISNFYAEGFEGLDIEAWQHDAWQAGMIGSFCRGCVPLFVTITGFLLLPLKQGIGMTTFYRRRASRIIIPFLIWGFLYGVYSIVVTDAVPEGKGTMVWLGEYAVLMLVNFPEAFGHLWYIYMIIGLYLFIPIISPWAERASRKDMHTFFLIWGVSLVLPYLKLIWPELLGECYWNPNSTLYYFTGFIGYLVFGAYCRKFLYEDGKSYTARGGMLALVGYVSTFAIFLYQLYNLAPAKDNYDNYFASFELSYNFAQPTVALLTIGFFLMLFKKNDSHEDRCVKSNDGNDDGEKRNGGLLYRTILEMSRLSYGVYLSHMMVLNYFYDVFGHMSCCTTVRIIVMGVSTISVTFIIMKLLSMMPRSKWITG